MSPHACIQKLSLFPCEFLDAVAIAFFLHPLASLHGREAWGPQVPLGNALQRTAVPEPAALDATERPRALCPTSDLVNKYPVIGL